MTEAITPASRKLEIGPVIERTFEVVGSNFLTFALLALVLSALPQLLLTLVTQNIDPQSVTPLAGLGFALGTFFSGVVTMITAVVLEAAIVHASVIHFNGGKPSVGAALRTGLRTILPLIGIALLVSFGVLLGFLVFIIPGIILAIRWSVTVPVRVMEGPGVFAAMKRSAALTKGSRWTIFFLGLVVGVLWIVVFGIVIGVPTAMLGAENPIIVFCLSPLASAVGALLSSAGAAALYYELRTRKEGASPSALAAVFD